MGSLAPFMGVHSCVDTGFSPWPGPWPPPHRPTPLPRETAMAEMPTGTVTFLFTDIEGSTHFWERQPDSMRRLLDHHNAILAASIDRHRGHVFKEWGDQFCAAFPDARDAADAAVDAQCALHEEVPQV